jgi:Tfp pilus assembly protein PilV
MRTDPLTEDGFGLIEVIVCVALLVAGSVLALALLPAVARASQAQLMREAATGIARNAIERTRAAAAYAPPAAMSDAAARAVTTSTHAWVLHPAAHFTSAVRVRRSLCAASGATTDVAVDVALAYDASNDALTVAATYPPDPCDVARQTTLTLRAIVAPPADAPQTRVGADIADPAQQ